MEHIRQAFNKFAQDYDAQREYIIPEMRQYYGAAVWAMETCSRKARDPRCRGRHRPPECLPAGEIPRCPPHPDGHLREYAGYGTEAVCDAAGTEYVVCDYSRSDLGGPYDIVCSALSIHHLSPEDKRLLFERIFTALKPGGIFVNADQADGETPYFTAAVSRLLERFSPERADDGRAACGDPETAGHP